LLRIRGRQSFGVESRCRKVECSRARLELNTLALARAGRWPPSSVSRRLASAQSLIVSSGGGFRMVSDCRTAVASRSGPVRISSDDRCHGELVEHLADRAPDLVADPGNRRLLVAERGQAC
jgi:hypothetical protein